jgi:hypothetical protein
MTRIHRLAGDARDLVPEVLTGGVSNTRYFVKYDETAFLKESAPAYDSSIRSTLAVFS